MPTTCVFQLDRFNPVYSSGEYINGRILLRTDKVKRVNAVYVTLEGEAKVQWSIGSKSETANYYGHQQYLYARTNVFDSTIFPPGTHVYALSLRIPPDCPTTCQGPYGYIAYNISLTVAKQWSFDEVFRKPISVLQTLDLNYNPEYALPIKDENIKYLCSWPCTSGPILTTLVVPRSAFAAGEDIPFLVEIDNQSPHYDIDGIEASLKQHYVFLARKPMKRNFHRKSLARTTLGDRTLRLTKRTYEGVVAVPAETPRSTLNPNYIVFLHYTLHVKLKTGPLHYDTNIAAPIVVGTVPLRQREGRERGVTTSQPVGSSTAMTASTTVGYGSMASTLDDEPPPSYDSCLPPSFSFATLGSQQTIDDGFLNEPREQRQRIQLPPFPDYNTFVYRSQAENNTNQFDLELDLNLNEDQLENDDEANEGDMDDERNLTASEKDSRSLEPKAGEQEDSL